MPTIKREYDEKSREAIERCRKLVESGTVTRSDIAAAAGLPKNTVIKYINGRVVPPADRTEAILKVLPELEKQAAKAANAEKPQKEEKKPEKPAKQPAPKLAGCDPEIGDYARGVMQVLRPEIQKMIRKEVTKATDQLAAEAADQIERISDRLFNLTQHVGYDPEGDKSSRIDRLETHVIENLEKDLMRYTDTEIGRIREKLQHSTLGERLAGSWLD